MKKIHSLYLILILFLLTPNFMTAQRILNFGLTEKQASETLPVSRSPFQNAARKKKTIEKTDLIKLSENEYLMSSGWELTDEHHTISSQQSIFDKNLNTADWYNATVPGTVLTTLVEQGIYPNPYWGLNNMAIPDSLCRMNWWYRLAFDIPQELKSERLQLLFNGINYKAEIWLNGQMLGTINGAFSRGKFYITDIADFVDKNILAVRILPPPNPGIGQEASFSAGHGPNGGIMCLDGPTFISSEGWDWVPTIRDRNIGIWQDVRLAYTDAVEIIDPQIITRLNLPDTTTADISIKTHVRNHSNTPLETKLNIRFHGVSVSYPVRLAGNEIKSVILTPTECPELRIANPRLWWPNGYGQQHLYNMELSAEMDGKFSDSKKVRFGIRELEYEFSVDSDSEKNVRINFNPLAAYKNGEPIFDNINRREIEGGLFLSQIKGEIPQEGITQLSDSQMETYLVVKVNGQRVFCKGGNWGMDDGMKRVSRERLEPAFRLHKEQHFNMIRNWTGESTEELFYELCDEYGMLVFNDFWLSTEGYNLNVADNKLFLDNVRETVIRFRNHPSIALWCPRNEGFAPASLENAINRIIAEEDGTRHYIPSSIQMNTTNSGPWDYKQPEEFYRGMAKGFNTEAGSPSVPTAETILSMMSVEDSWPIGDVWSYHDWHMGQWGGQPFIKSYKDAIDNMYGESDNLFDFCKKAQLVNYESYKTIFESWNSRLWDNTSGVLLWMSHPAWPSVVWQTYSYDFETPGAYFGSRKACTPLHIQMDLDTYKVKLINTSLQDYTGLKISARVYAVDGEILQEKNAKADISGNSKKELFKLDEISDYSEILLVKLYLYDGKGICKDDNFYWLAPSGKKDFTVFNTLPQLQNNIEIISLKQEEEGWSGKVKITNNTNTPSIGIKLNIVSLENKQPILPCYFEDGYFTLIPTETKYLDFFLPHSIEQSSLGLRIEGYNHETLIIDLSE